MKEELIKFMMWMAINDRKPYENYEEVVNAYLSTDAVKNNAVLPLVSNNEVAVCDLNPDFQKYLKEQGETHCPQCGKKLIAN